MKKCTDVKWSLVQLLNYELASSAKINWVVIYKKKTNFIHLNTRTFNRWNDQGWDASTCDMHLCSSAGNVRIHSTAIFVRGRPCGSPRAIDVDAGFAARYYCRFPAKSCVSVQYDCASPLPRPTSCLRLASKCANYY
jgi:hypothetical protein